jgi:glutamate---cysteine ligase / carboxylate-amine ligase
VHDASEEPSPAATSMREAFDQSSSGTVGLEEELLLLDAETLDLAPRAPEAIAALDGDPRFKLEMPAAQLEIVTAPHASVAGAAGELAEARAVLARTVAGRFCVAGAGAHPFAPGLGPLNPGPRYDAIGAEYATVARRQLVFGLHVHVAVRGAGRALAVYNAMRSYLPELAALGANAPFYEGRDSGLASVRSRISGLLPRQGVPPAFAGFDAYEEALRWCGFEDPRQWWWELRLHPTFGTVEVRVPDTQRTVEDSAAIGTLVHALIGDLAARHDAGEPLPVHDSWRIDQNRWSACRHGIEGDMADLASGRRERTRDRLEALLERLGLDLPLESRAARQREVAAERGLRGLVRWLSDGFAG